MKTSTVKGIFISIIALVVLSAIGFYVFLQIKKSKHVYFHSDYTMAYENPGDDSYYIVFDKWDTLEVKPHSASADIDYNWKLDQKKIQVQVFTQKFKQLKDTTFNVDDLEKHFREANKDNYGEKKILINPGNFNFVAWNIWYSSEDTASNNFQIVTLGDSTYFGDVTVYNGTFILDHTDNLTAFDLKELSNFGTEDKQSFLLNEKDFMAAYYNVYRETQNEDAFNDFRNKFVELFDKGRDEYLYKEAENQDKVVMLNDLNTALIERITDETSGKDFESVCQVLDRNQEFYKELDANLYYSIKQQQDSILALPLNTIKPKAMDYATLKDMGYYMQRKGFWDDILYRDIESNETRNADGTLSYSDTPSDELRKN